MNYLITLYFLLFSCNVYSAVLDFALQPASTQTATTEWVQHGHDAQHTGWTPQTVPTPWKLKWIWGGQRVLPDKVQPVFGGGRMYIVNANGNGISAVSEANGQQVWSRNPGGSVLATPAYDTATNTLFVISNDGRLYKLNASDGSTIASFNTNNTVTGYTGAPCLIDDRVFVSAGNRVFAIRKSDMQQIWSYDAGSSVRQPPAYSPSRDCVIVGTQDLYVHAINNSNGTQKWRVKPTVRTGPNDYRGTDTSCCIEWTWGWPVIAEQHGLVLMRLRLETDAVWHYESVEGGSYGAYPPTNEQIRTYFQNYPEWQCVFALKLDDGTKPFICNIGCSDWADSTWSMGSQPCVAKLSNGKEVVYSPVRMRPCIPSYCDGRWDYHMGEMVLDDTTVSGYQAGYIRCIRTMVVPTDESPYVSAAGDDYVFGGHWMFGLAVRITDRSSTYGSASNPIPAEDLPHIAESQAANEGCTRNDTTHYCSNGLVNAGDWRSAPPGFWIYWNISNVYDSYWNNYCIWIVNNNTIYYRSNTGAVVALEHGNPQ